MKNECVSVNKYSIESEMYYKDVPVLHYKIQYPQFIQDCNERVMNKINLYYWNSALDLQKTFESQMYNEAIELYEYSITNDFPFHMYEAYVSYELTYNQGCTISLYFDKYIFSGGAHGNTLRTSNTWNLQNGCQILLYENFAYYLNYRAYIINMINEQIADQISSGDNFYFEDYNKLVIENFNEDSYYLNPEGIVIYYQQYDIAPYASGIPEFTIPYHEGIVNHPACQYII